ncbi:MAG: hypothetical protein HS116_21205 [Planctomycetes bacterium]|nr:hypothetical protein [Planctomycetota bacterium]
MKSILLILVGLTSSAVFAEAVALKDGQVLEGEVLTNTAWGITLDLPGKGMMVIPRDRIKKIGRTKEDVAANLASDTEAKEQVQTSTTPATNESRAVAEESNPNPKTPVLQWGGWSEKKATASQKTEEKLPAYTVYDCGRTGYVGAAGLRYGLVFPRTTPQSQVNKVLDFEVEKRRNNMVTFPNGHVEKVKVLTLEVYNGPVPGTNEKKVVGEGSDQTWKWSKDNGLVKAWDIDE